MYFTQYYIIVLELPKVITNFGEINFRIMNILENVLTVKEYSARFKKPIRSINILLQHGILPEHVLSFRKSGTSRTAIHLLLINPEKKNKKK